MASRILLLALTCLLASSGIAQPLAVPVPEAADAPAAVAIAKPATVRVGLQTSKGSIVLELESERAPITTANFLRYVDRRRFDGITFYRATKVGPGYGLIQGGVRYDPKKVLPSIAHEPTTRTGLTHQDGTISMARAAPGTANGDFFICVGAMPSMDAQPDQPGDNLGFAAFGHVVEGMDIVRAILDAPTSPTAGVGAMKGQMLSPPITITTARRLP
jgi:peptidyl-prolyl cis-trans isomerase A (cyclophilin A)